MQRPPVDLARRRDGVDFETRWPEALDRLEPELRGLAVDALRRILRDGFPVDRDDVERVVQMTISDPEWLEALHAPHEILPVAGTRGAER